MTCRTLSPFAKSHADVEKSLSQLFVASQNASSNDYRAAMRSLGESLAEYIADGHSKLLSDPDRDFYLACTVEDADFLCKGLLDGLSHKVTSSTNLKFACFWNERVKSEGYSVAPIIKSYLEEKSHTKTTVIIAKSVISGACVVKTNLMRMLDEVKPDTVLVVAPVMHADSQDKLKSEFPKSVAEKFEFLYFAKDAETNAAGEVLPGVGGNVYDLLGLGGSKVKNTYLPELVRQRRSLILA